MICIPPEFSPQFTNDLTCLIKYWRICKIILHNERCTDICLMSNLSSTVWNPDYKTTKSLKQTVPTEITRNPRKNDIMLAVYKPQKC